MINIDLHDRIAIVSGGDSGIGAACARALADAGADVAVLYHSAADKAEAVVQDVLAIGRNALAIQVNLADEQSVDQAFEKVRQDLGRVDILVNSAGLNISDTRVEEMNLAQWEKLVGTDLTGTFLTCRRFVRDLAGDHHPASIINITSIHAFAVRAGGADYCASKAGQHRLTQTLAVEVADRGITVNSIAPGMILTPMNQEALDDEETLREREQNIPARRAGKPEEIASVAVFLASPAAAYVTGAEVIVDGGLSLLQGVGA